MASIIAENSFLSSATPKISPHTPSERYVDYSRAELVKDQHISISNTTSQDDQGKIHGRNIGKQTKFML